MYKDDVLSSNWAELKWTEWEPLKNRKMVPNLPGIYRIRAKEVNHLFYIGQTGDSLSKRLTALSKQTYAIEMPFNDPHTAAPNLWVYLNEYGYEYECSVTTINTNKTERMGYEDYLLWRHRVATGVSTQCNYGRFHKGYTKSSLKNSGQRGLKLTDGIENPSGGSSMEPLLLLNNPMELNWMGLDWYTVVGTRTVPKELNHLPCVYKMIDKKLNDIVYLGQTIDCRNRLNNHPVLKKIKLDLKQYEVQVAYFDSNILRFQLHEIESDLLGAYYHLTRKAPKYQYGGQ